MTHKAMTIADAVRRLEALGVPEGWAQESDAAKLDFYFDRFQSLEKTLWQEHLQTLSWYERLLLRFGKHASQDWRRQEAAQRYADRLASELASYGFADRVEVGGYHGNLNVLTVYFKPGATWPGEVVPFLYHGFRVKWAFAVPNDPHQVP